MSNIKRTLTFTNISKFNYNITEGNKQIGRVQLTGQGIFNEITEYVDKIYSCKSQIQWIKTNTIKRITVEFESKF